VSTINQVFGDFFKCKLQKNVKAPIDVIWILDHTGLLLVRLRSVALVRHQIMEER
jgi:hypothetical protein